MLQWELLLESCVLAGLGGGLSRNLLTLTGQLYFFEFFGKETQFADRFWGLAVELFQTLNSDMILV